MSSLIDELKFTWMDVMQLFGIEEKGQEKLLPDKRMVEGWRLEPNLIICSDGIFIDTEYTVGVAMTPGDRQSYMSHPDGDPRVPLVEFPCSLENLREFDNYDLEMRIDPFDLAEMVAMKIASIKVGSLEKIASYQEIEPSSNNFPLHTDRLMKMAIEVQHKFWKYPEISQPSQKAIMDYLREKYGISEAKARAIEQVACPIDRTQ